MLSWMAWAPEVATFSGCTVLMLASMTMWEAAHPTVGRKGFLLTTTTYGDHLFTGLLTAAYINLAWVGLTLEETSAWGSSVASMVVLIIVVWRG